MYALAFCSSPTTHFHSLCEIFFFKLTPLPQHAICSCVTKGLYPTEQNYIAANSSKLSANCSAGDPQRDWRHCTDSTLAFI